MSKINIANKSQVLHNRIHNLSNPNSIINEAGFMDSIKAGWKAFKNTYKDASVDDTGLIDYNGPDNDNPTPGFYIKKLNNYSFSYLIDASSDKIIIPNNLTIYPSDNFYINNIWDEHIHYWIHCMIDIVQMYYDQTKRDVIAIYHLVQIPPNNETEIKFRTRIFTDMKNARLPIRKLLMFINNLVGETIFK